MVVKPRSRDHEKVNGAINNQKQREGETPNGATLKGAERRASLRAARNPAKLARVQKTMGSADVAVRGHLENWQDPEISVQELESVHDPAHARWLATHTASLRDGADIDRFAARAEDSSAGVMVSAASRKAGAARKRKEGESATYYRQEITGDGRVKVRRVRIKRTGPQVRAHRDRKPELEAMPVEQRPTYVSQTTTYLRKSMATGSRNGQAYVRPAGVRSLAEISAQTQAQRVTGPDARGNCRMKIPKSLFSDKALVRMGFPRPRDKPKRAFDFKGPTAEADARAFDKKLMGWLKKWKKGVGPPPLPRKP